MWTAWGKHLTAGYKSSESFLVFGAWYAWWKGTNKSEIGDIELCTDDDGDRYLCHIKERQTKTRVVSDLKDVRKFKPKIWNQSEDKSRCTIET